MGRPFELLTLSEGERVELGALAPAARRHRPWRFAPGSSSCRVTGSPTRMWRRGWVSIRSRLANGGGASWKAVPVDLDVHLVMDTYATHKTPLIRDWLLKRPRWPVHHTPTGATRPREVTGTDPYIAPEECVARLCPPPMCSGWRCWSMNS